MEREKFLQNLLTWIGLLIAASPIIAVILTVVGYYIMINYYRLIKINNIRPRVGPSRYEKIQ